jgi:hypothetical protein
MSRANPANITLTVITSPNPVPLAPAPALSEFNAGGRMLL